MNKIIKYLKNPLLLIGPLGYRGWFNWIKDDRYLQILFRTKMKRPLNLDNPQTFNEKLQWLKLHDRKPIYTVMVDKYTAKKYVAKKIGKEYIIPTLGVWDRFDDIDFDMLPNQFVLKCTHDSGGLVICRDKSKFDKKLARKKITASLKRNYYYFGREWPYKNIKPRIIAEKYMQNNSEENLTDYKFFCFNGEPRIMYISKDNSQNPTTDFFDMNYNLLNIRMKDPNSEQPPEKPEQFDKMIGLAKIISQNIPHLRVDFYIVKGSIFVGELTFFHNSGFTPIRPYKWDLKLGKWIDLNMENNTIG